MPERTTPDAPSDSVNRPSGLLDRLERIEADIAALRVELSAKADSDPESGLDPSVEPAAHVYPNFMLLNRTLQSLASGASQNEVVDAYLQPVALHLDRFILFRWTQLGFVVQASQGFGDGLGETLRLEDPEDPVLRCAEEARLLYFEWDGSGLLPSWLREQGEPNRWGVCIPFVFQRATPIVLYGDRSSPILTDFLELLTHFAVLVLKNQRLQNLAGLALRKEDPQDEGSAVGAREVSSDSDRDRAKRQHQEAARLARLLVSEIQIYNEEQIEKGRLNRDLYVRLQADLERNREVYQGRVHPTVAGQVDYFHQETVRLLAQGDETLLGSQYPGQFVVSSQPDAPEP